jgi:hypothetical protein
MRTLVGAIFAVLVALACSACGSTHTQPVTTIKHAVKKAPLPLTLPSAANLVIVPTQNGTGNEKLGTFTASGTVYFEFSCKGEGPLTIGGILEHISPCDGSPTGASVPYHTGEPVHLAVRAKPGTTWRLAVGEHVPGATLVLVHRSGTGSESLGTFVMRGHVDAATSCTGRGDFSLGFTPTSGKAVPGIGTVCPQPPPASVLHLYFPAADGRRVQVYVDAAPNAHWTVTLTETK